MFIKNNIYLNILLLNINIPFLCLELHSFIFLTLCSVVLIYYFILQKFDTWYNMLKEKNHDQKKKNIPIFSFFACIYLP